MGRPMNTGLTFQSERERLVGSVFLPERSEPAGRCGPAFLRKAVAGAAALLMNRHAKGAGYKTVGGCANSRPYPVTSIAVCVLPSRFQRSTGFDVMTSRPITCSKVSIAGAARSGRGGCATPAG